MFCKMCGSQIPDGVSYCVNCGTAAEIPSPPPAPAPQETVVFSPIIETPPQPVPQETTVYNPVTESMPQYREESLQMQNSMNPQNVAPATPPPRPRLL